MVRFFQICSVSLFLISSLVFGQTLYNNFPVTNGTVNSIVQSGNNIYLGGLFSYVGPNTGRGVGIDPSTGLLISGFPDVNGTIYKVVSDDAGGWYIGGSFTYVGGYARNAIAHIKSDKTVDTWNPNVNDGLTDNFQKVYTIAKYGSTIYVGGLFTQVGSNLRTNVAAIDSATGLATSWNPGPDNAVYSIIVTPQYTFLGGTFTYFAGAIDTTNPLNIPGGIPNNKRQALAELYTGQNILTFYNTQQVSGAIACQTPYGSSTGISVYAMQLVNGRLYIAGNFSTFAGINCFGLTSVDTTNTYYPVATGFAPNKNNSLKFRPSFSLAVSGDTVFVGGEFLYFGPLNTVRHHIAAALISTGAGLSTWNPDIATNGASEQSSNPYYVNSIVVANGIVYVAGKFKTINTSVSRSNLAAINQSGSATATSWNPNPSSLVFSIALQGSSLYIGGNFTSVNGQTRNNLASINALSGTLNSWNPNAGDQVTSLVVYGSSVFAGGYFSNIGADSRSFLAAIDMATGLATSWQANVSGGVSSLALGNNLLYVGGTFTAIGGTGSGDVARNYIAAVDPVTGVVSSWDPNGNGTVNSLLVNGSTIYCGGTFNSMGGQSRRCLAALDATTGLATSWDPNPDNLVSALGIQGSNIYAGGGFTNIGGQSRNYLACIDASTGNATSWNPNLSGGGYTQVNALVVTNSVIFVGGVFTSIGASTRNYVAGIDVTTGNATSWSPDMDQFVNAISVDVANQKIYLGGIFTNILNTTASSFAVVDYPGFPWSFQISPFTALIEGFYNGTTMIPDTVTLELHNAVSPHSLVSSSKGLLDANGHGSFAFAGAVSGTPYYLVVKHRNAVETWSAAPTTAAAYDFTSAQSQAYGSNMNLKGTKWCIYSGDVNHDGIVDSGDLGVVDNDNANYVSGYTITDVNGDGIVDSGDLGLVDNNNANYVGKITPSRSPVATRVIRQVKIQNNNIK